MSQAYSDSKNRRFIFAMIGVGIICWKIVVGVHDIDLSVYGSSCAEKVLGPEFFQSWFHDKKLVEENKWNEAAVRFIENFKNFEKENQAVEALKQNCSSYMSISKSNTSSIANQSIIERYLIEVHNWALFDKNPAILKDRITSIVLWTLFVLLCLVDLRRAQNKLNQFLRK